MNSHRSFPLLIVAAASIGAYVMTGPHHAQTPELRARPHATVERSATFGSLSNIPLSMQDITLHAFEHLDDVNPIETNPSALPDWNPNWELRWQDFVTADGRVVRVYHATSRQHPSIRFTVTADSENPAIQTWERAQ